MATKMLLTAGDFERVVSRLPEDRRYELIRGEIYAMGGVTKRHGEIAIEIGARLREWNRRTKAGSIGAEVGYTLERGPDTVRVPDVFFIAKGRVSREQSRRGYAEVAPDLIVEIRSPSDSWQSLMDRAEQFLEHGSRMALLVEADQFIEVLRPGEQPERLTLADVFDGADVLPGFSCRVADFFPEEY
ncbi:MAG TPA: Uma2 family endonuclease [Chloroflexota bacterium]|nr:Uma2 family endonuclease [Chloroflexota bacterium]